MFLHENPAYYRYFVNTSAGSMSLIVLCPCKTNTSNWFQLFCSISTKQSKATLCVAFVMYSIDFDTYI